MIQVWTGSGTDYKLNIPHWYGSELNELGLATLYNSSSQSQ